MTLFTDKILKATVSDLPQLMETFMACTAEMKKHGIDQWNYQYPEPTEVLNDIRAGMVYVIKNSKRIVASVTLNEKQDAQYENVVWGFPSDKVLVMHRLAVHPVSQGMGISKRLCKFTDDFALKNGYEVIRLDAYSDNPVSNNLYLSQGYEIAAGVCFFHGVKKPFYCYEKKIKKGEL